MVIQQPHGESEPALALLAERRQALLERISLAAHDVLAPEGVAFSRVRDACEATLDALAASLRDQRVEPPGSTPAERLVASAVHKEVPFEALVRALHAALGTYVALVSESEGRPAVELTLAASRLVQRLVAAAAVEVDAAHRGALRRRAALVDRMRTGAQRFADTSLDQDAAIGEIVRVTADVLRCDWCGLALPEADGRLVIAGVVGRGAGWVQRWALRNDGGFVRAALGADGAVLVADSEGIPFEGDDRPRSLLAAVLRDANGQFSALLFAGRDAGEALGMDDLTLADAVADGAAKALEAARAAAGTRRLSGQLAALRHAVAAALAGDQAASLGLLATVAARLARCDIALLRLVDVERGALVTRAVHADSPAVAAELAGTTDDLEGDAISQLLAGEEVPLDGALASTVARRLPSSAVTALALPIDVGGRIVGGLELVRLRRDPLGEDERELARHVAAQVGLIVGLGSGPAPPNAAPTLDAIVEALAAGGDLSASARCIARHAADAVGARGALVYARRGDELELAGAHGVRAEELAGAPGAALALDALRRDEALLTGGEAGEVEALAGRGSAPAVVSVPLRARGEPAGVLLLLFGEHAAAATAMSSAALAVLATRAGEPLQRAREADRVRNRLAHVAALYDAAAPTGPLSADDLLAAAVRAAGAERGAILARGADDRLHPVALRDAGDAAVRLVAALLDEASADAGATNLLVRDELLADARLADAARAADAGAAIVAPLRDGSELVGAMAVLFEGRTVPREAGESVMRLGAPAASVVAASERRMRTRVLEHEVEDARRRADEAGRARDAFDLLASAALEGRDADQALARAAARGAGAAAAAVQLAGEPQLRPVALHVEEGSTQEAVRRVLGPGLTADDQAVRRALGGEVVVLDAAADGEGPLGPFLRAGSSAALVPLGRPGAVRGVVVVVSLDPNRPLDADAAAVVRRLTVL
jgi:hypothetical protein